MQVAATSPRYVSVDDVAADDWSGLEEEFGGRKEAQEAAVLLEQPFIKDAKFSVRDVIRDSIAKLGENIVVRRFARFEVGSADAPAAP